MRTGAYACAVKNERRQTILRLVRETAIESQEQLRTLLRAAGFDVNQGTLSRDLRALRVVKVPRAHGGARYQPADRIPDRAVAVTNLRAFVRDVVPAGNLLLVRTRVGGAQPAALAIDQLGVEGIVGTVAGDDTILAVVADGHAPRDAIAALWALIDGGLDR